MKRAFIVLFLLMLGIYAKEAYHTYVSALEVEKKLTGSLSDIAEEVIAIPLQPADGLPIEKARYIREQGNNLFLINEDVLYRYNRKGEFICRITRPEEIHVAGYIINPLKQQLIVLGNENDIFYYTFEGELTDKKKLANGFSHNKQVISMSVHDNRILSLEQNTYIDPDTQQMFVEKEVVAYDTSFRPVYTRKLTSADLGRPSLMVGLLQPEICWDKSSGSIFAYCPSLRPELLLQDTLFLKQTWKDQMQYARKRKYIPVTPVRPAGRFWLSSFHNPADESKNYTFCYDNVTHEYHQVKGGLRDNFYHTGNVILEAMDIYNESYCFAKSGDSIKKAFPGNAENAVVFIVKLKSV